MQPTPGTAGALRQLSQPQAGRLLTELRDRSDRAHRVVPDCVGVSFGSLQRGVTFTLVAADAASHLVDDDLDDGPDPVGDVGGRADDELMHEESWQSSAQATAAAGVRSSLTMPIMVGGRVTASVSLYASSSTAFAGHHEEIADIFDAWAPGAVSNADLAFETRVIADAAPGILSDQRAVALAAAVLAGRDGVDNDAAHRHLEEAARRARVSDAVFARYVLEYEGLDDLL